MICALKIYAQCMCIDQRVDISAPKSDKHVTKKCKSVFSADVSAPGLCTCIVHGFCVHNSRLGCDQSQNNFCFLCSKFQRELRLKLKCFPSMTLWLWPVFTWTFGTSGWDGWLSVEGSNWLPFPNLTRVKTRLANPNLWKSGYHWVWSRYLGWAKLGSTPTLRKFKLGREYVP